MFSSHFFLISEISTNTFADIFAHIIQCMFGFRRIEITHMCWNRKRQQNCLHIRVCFCITFRSNSPKTSVDTPYLFKCGTLKINFHLILILGSLDIYCGHCILWLLFYYLDPVLKVNRKYIPGALILRIINLNRCTYLHLIRSPDGSFERER